MNKLHFLPFWLAACLGPLLLPLGASYIITTFQQRLSEQIQAWDSLTALSISLAKQKETCALYETNFAQDADAFFLALENHPWMEKMTRRLQAMQSCNCLSDHEQQRLEALTHPNQRLLFSRQYLRAQKGYDELQFSQKQAVEVDAEDLQSLLMLLEGAQGSSQLPFFIIHRFELEKKSHQDEECFSVKMDLLQFQKKNDS